MKKFRFFAVILALLMALTAFVACGGSEESKKPTPGDETEQNDNTDPEKPDDDNKEPKPEIKPVERPTVEGEPYGAGRTLGIHLYGQQPLGFDQVVEEYKNRTKDIFAFDIKFQFYDINQYKQTLTLNVANPDSNMDLVFDAQWINLQEWANNGNYVPLDGYFHNPDNYPGLAKVFDETYCNNNKFNDGIYGVPLTESFGDTTAVFYRQDWVKESGIPELQDGITSIAEFETYLQWVKDNKKGVTPFIANKDGNNSPYSVLMSEPDNIWTVDQANALGIKNGIILKPGITATAYIDPATQTVVDAYINNYESPAVLQSFPQPYNNISTFMGDWQKGYTKVREWQNKGFTSKNIATEIDCVAKFKMGQAGAMVTTLSEFTRIQSGLISNVPEAEMEAYIYDTPTREKMKHIMPTDFRAWNFLAVPKSSPDLDLAMLFLDWIFASRENHDLFQYGIEGENWEKIDPDPATGEGAYEYKVDPKVHKPYTFPGYLLTWNPNYLRMPKVSSNVVREYTEFVYDMDTYGETLYSGFVFDFTPVDVELSNAAFGSGLTDHVPYYIGTVDGDVVAKWTATMNSRYQNESLQSDIQIIKSSLIDQLQNYIDNN